MPLDLPDCPTCRSSSFGKCATHRQPTVFRDRYFLTIDLDPETEANVRADERHLVLDEVGRLVSEFLYGIELDALRRHLDRLRPSRPRRP